MNLSVTIAGVAGIPRTDSQTDSQTRKQLDAAMSAATFLVLLVALLPPPPPSRGGEKCHLGKGAHPSMVSCMQLSREVLQVTCILHRNSCELRAGEEGGAYQLV